MNDSLENVELPYKYYITYTANSPEGFVRGAVDVERSDPLSDFEQVEAVASLIAENNSKLSDVVIAGWQKYEQT